MANMMNVGGAPMREPDEGVVVAYHEGKWLKFMIGRPSYEGGVFTKRFNLNATEEPQVLDILVRRAMQRSEGVASLMAIVEDESGKAASK